MLNKTVQCGNCGMVRSIPLTLGEEDFKALRLDGSVYVDKSEMLHEYLERGGVVLIITKPRKWGKSINISMFKYFFDIETDENGVAVDDDNKQHRVLFTGGNIKTFLGKVKNIKALKIAQHLAAMEHQGSNPVVLLSFKNVSGTSYESFTNSITNSIELIYNNYPYLIRYMKNSTALHNRDTYNILDNIRIENSLYYLSKILFRHFKRNVYIFIDDFDMPIANAFVYLGKNSEEFNKVVDLIYKIIKRAFKDNRYLERGILTGTFHFGWLNEILHLSSVRHSTFIDTTFCKFYGLTSTEVDSLLSTFPINISSNTLQEWYGGYRFEDETMYNPWSSLSCLANNGQLRYYWQEVTEANSQLVECALLLDNTQHYLHQLLQDKIIVRKDINKPINLQNMEETFHRTLLFGGYFNFVSSTCDARCYIHPWNVTLPNREVKAMVANGISKWVANKLSIHIDEYLNLIHFLATFQIENFKEMFKKCLLNSKFLRTLDDQQMYHQLMGGLLSSLANNFTVSSQRLPGQRSRTYILVPYPDLGSNMMIIEYQVCKVSKKLETIIESGLDRMKNRLFNQNMTNFKYVKQVLKMYLGVSKKKVAARYDIVQVNLGKRN